MFIEIINLYSNEALSGLNLIPAHGQSFLIKAENHQILMDVGWKGKILLNNMKSLGIDPNDITQLVISHGHIDHVGALPEFLDARKQPIPMLAHPGIKESKRFEVFSVTKDIGFPELTKEQKKKLDITYTKKPKSILPFLKTTGEISKRLHRDGTEPLAQHKVFGRYIQEFHLAFPNLLNHFPLLIGRHAGVQVTGSNSHVPEVVHLVFHKRNQRRDNYRHTVSQQGRQLEA